MIRKLLAISICAALFCNEAAQAAPGLHAFPNITTRAAAPTLIQEQAIASPDIFELGPINRRESAAVIVMTPRGGTGSSRLDELRANTLTDVGGFLNYADFTLIEKAKSSLTGAMDLFQQPFEVLRKEYERDHFAIILEQLKEFTDDALWESIQHEKKVAAVILYLLVARQLKYFPPLTPEFQEMSQIDIPKLDYLRDELALNQESIVPEQVVNGTYHFEHWSNWEGDVLVKSFHVNDNDKPPVIPPTEPGRLQQVRLLLGVQRESDKVSVPESKLPPGNYTAIYVVINDYLKQLLTEAFETEKLNQSGKVIEIRTSEKVLTMILERERERHSDPWLKAVFFYADQDRESFHLIAKVGDGWIRDKFRPLTRRDIEHWEEWLFRGFGFYSTFFAMVAAPPALAWLFIYRLLIITNYK